MQLFETVGLDRNTLPYVVQDATLGRVPVRFAPLTASDLPEINGPRWAGSIFAPTWGVLAGDGRTLKLIRTTETGQNIEGIVRLGNVPLGSRALRDSLLEAAPTNQYAAANDNRRPLSGVGRVLIARLIVEGYNSGGNGALFIRARDEAIGFYQHLGAGRNQNRKELLLPAAQASALFAFVTM